MNGLRSIILSGCVILGCVVGASAAEEAPAEPVGEATAAPELLQAWNMSWWSVDGGGGSSSGGAFAVIGSLGQPDAGSADGGGMSLTGGVWSGSGSIDVLVFSDGFESGGTESWSAVVP